MLVTAFAALMFPAGAMASDTITTAGVAKKDGFKLSLRIIQGGPGGGGFIPNSVTGVLKKQSVHATQAASYDFLHSINFKASKNLSFATVRGSFANSRGSIDMTFHATGPMIHPKGCRGRQQGRRGVLQGTYTVHADKLGRITERSFMATLWSAYSPRCSSRGYRGHGYLLFTPRFKRPHVRVSKSSATGHVSEQIEVERSTRKSFIAYSYVVTGEPAQDYKVAPNLLSANVTGAGGISGTATYSAKATLGNNCCSIGTLNGRLAVTMPAIGRVRPFAKGPERASEHRL